MFFFVLFFCWIHDWLEDYVQTLINNPVFFFTFTIKQWVRLHADSKKQNLLKSLKI